MSSLHKDFDHALARIGTYLHGQTAHDKYTNVKAYMYKQKLSLEEHPESFDIRVKRDTGRFEVPHFLNGAADSFPEQVDKYGVQFGPSFSTHMFRVCLKVPKSWLTKQSEIHFLWDGGCEGSLYNAETGKHLQGFSDQVRQVYHIKNGEGKNDLDDPTIAKEDENGDFRVCYLLEMACNGMLGNFNGEPIWGGILDMEKQFALTKCELGLFNPKIEELFFSVSMIRDAAKLLDKK